MRWGESSDPFDSGGSALIQASVGGDRTGPATATRRQVTLLFIEDSDTEASRFFALLEQAAPARFDMARVTTIAEATPYLQVNATDGAVVDLRPAAREPCRSITGAPAARSPLPRPL